MHSCPFKHFRVLFLQSEILDGGKVAEKALKRADPFIFRFQDSLLVPGQPRLAYPVDRKRNQTAGIQKQKYPPVQKQKINASQDKRRDQCKRIEPSSEACRMFSTELKTMAVITKTNPFLFCDMRSFMIFPSFLLYDKAGKTEKRTLS